MFTMNIPLKAAAVAVGCGKCHEQIAEDAARCAVCGCELPPAEPKTLVGKIKRALGIELSDIVAINLEDRSSFFTSREIDEALKMENLTVLDLEDVPGFDTMFYNSKRIGKPLNRIR